MSEEELEYKVRTETFEGPMDLLLILIEKRKLYINDVSLAAVTDDYISYINKLKEFPIPKSAHFILVASTLLLIKSKSLLPTLELSREEEASIEDLERRLTIYKYIRKLSLGLQSQFGKQILFPRTPSQKREPIFSPFLNLSPTSMHEGIQIVLRNLPRKEQMKKAVVQKVISLEEMVERLTLRVAKNLRMSFNEFSKSDKSERIRVIVGFLAMLELVKQGIITVAQEKDFSDIVMESDRVSTPKY